MDLFHTILSYSYAFKCEDTCQVFSLQRGKKQLKTRRKKKVHTLEEFSVQLKFCNCVKG